MATFCDMTGDLFTVRVVTRATRRYWQRQWRGRSDVRLRDEIWIGRDGKRILIRTHYRTVANRPWLHGQRTT